MPSRDDRFVYEDDAITRTPIVVEPRTGSIAVQGADAIAGAEITRSINQLGTTVRQNLGRLIRYSVTSGLALGVSEITLIALYASHTFDATLSAFLANLAGTVPSYLLSRYWIWSESDRKRVGRQVVLYWLTSLLSMAITSLATGALTAIAPAGHKAHVLVAGVGFVGVSIMLWVTKYVVYQKVIFRDQAADELTVR